MNKICGIYKITNNTNNKVYIGQTVDYRKRKNRHLSQLKTGKHFNAHLQNAFDLHGFDNFKIELICECKTEQLDELEKQYIKIHDSTDGEHGYNMMYGGQVFREFTPEVRARMSKTNKGRKFTEEHRKRIGESRKGFKMSDESIKAIVDKRTKNKSLFGEKNGNATITNNVAEQIIIELCNGITVNEISAKYNASKETVYNLMYNKSYKDILPDIRETLSNRTIENRNNKINKAIQLYKQGKSQNAISKELNISRNTLRRELISRGIDTQNHVNQSALTPSARCFLFYNNCKEVKNWAY